MSGLSFLIRQCSARLRTPAYKSSCDFVLDIVDIRSGIEYLYGHLNFSNNFVVLITNNNLKKAEPLVERRNEKIILDLNFTDFSGQREFQLFPKESLFTICESPAMNFRNSPEDS